MRGLPRLSEPVPTEPVVAAAHDQLLEAALELAGAQDVARVAEIVRRAARALTGADGVTFVLREGDEVHYLDENAIAPLWKGSRFPAEACISGWAMRHRRTVVIEDVFEDPRIPHHLYAPTFVKSLAMVPVRPEDPVAAIGAYWAVRHRATSRELGHIGALAGFAAVALANAALVAELRQAIEARDTFMAVASHELRTPLSALALQVGLCERQLSAAGEQGPVCTGVGRIGRATRRLTELVDRLLDLSTLRQRPLALHREPVDLAAVAREAADVVAGAGQAEIRIDAPAPVVGSFDRVRISQVLENLVGNAVKFGSGKPVDVAISSSGGRARVVVRDRGIGIPEEARERIFERFERAVPTRNYGGFGLGLWLVRQTVEAHGGTVAVASAPGEGATFTVELPLR
jgi:two-component system CheB/CheR fusion protein